MIRITALLAAVRVGDPALAPGAGSDAAAGHSPASRIVHVVLSLHAHLQVCALWCRACMPVPQPGRTVAGCTAPSPDSARYVQFQH